MGRSAGGAVAAQPSRPSCPPSRLLKPRLRSQAAMSETHSCPDHAPSTVESGPSVESRRGAWPVGVGGLSGAFATGPQAESRGYVSSPRSPNPAGRFPAPGSLQWNHAARARASRSRPARRAVLGKQYRSQRCFPRGPPAPAASQAMPSCTRWGLGEPYHDPDSRTPGCPSFGHHETAGDVAAGGLWPPSPMAGGRRSAEASTRRAGLSAVGRSRRVGGGLTGCPRSREP